MPASTTPLTLSALTPSARRRCTEVVAAHEVATLDICQAGQIVALHAHTRQGRVVLYVPAEEFAAKHFAKNDANGVPYRAPAATGATENQLAADAAVTTPKDDAAVTKTANPAETRERCERIWAALTAQPFQSVDQLVFEHGLGRSTFNTWLYKNHPQGLVALRWQARPPKAAERVKGQYRAPATPKAVYEKLWGLLVAAPHQSVRVLAEDHGVPANAFFSYISRHHRGELPRRRLQASKPISQ